MAKFFRRISESNLVPFDLKRPHSAWQHMREGRVSIGQSCSPSKETGPRHPINSRDLLYMRMRNRNQILHSDQTRRDENF